MAGRKEPLDSLDFFPTPPWATRALVEHVIAGHGWRLDQLAVMSCWEPACGQGHMARPLAEYFDGVTASDCHAYGFGEVHDFLMPGSIPWRRPDWIITNPPFRLAEQFALRALGIARVGVAMLCRTTFIEGIDRYRKLFAPRPPAIFAPFVERVPMVKGRVDDKASSATSYSWFVWDTSGQRHRPPEIVWIPPCRKRLERPADYLENDLTGVLAAKVTRR